MKLDMGAVRSPKQPKEMLSMDKAPDGKLEVRINYSSLELIQTCKRKAMYALKQELRGTIESDATLFGSAIHKGLEVWYLSERSSRAQKGPDCTDTGEGHDCARCRSMAAFYEKSRPLEYLDITDKRHPSNGQRILDKYFTSYLDDPFVVATDKHGPIVERRFEFVLHETPSLRIIYFGTIDAILQNTETNTVLVVDHKTTAALGSDFYNRLRPNHQYTGYIMGANRALGLETNLFMVNGLQVAKTKADFARQITQRDEHDFEELRNAVVFAVRDFIDSSNTGIWPQNAPNPCTMYGGCGYRQICEASAEVRGNVINSLYQTQETAAHG